MATKAPIDELQDIIADLIDDGSKQSDNQVDEEKKNHYKILLEKCPLWLLKKTKEEIQRRIEIENQYSTKIAQIKEYEKELKHWKTTIEKDFEKKTSDYKEHVKQLNDKVKSLEEELSSKQKSIDDLQNEMKRREANINNSSTTSDNGNNNNNVKLNEMNLMTTRTTSKTNVQQTNIITNTNSRLFDDNNNSNNSNDSNNVAIINFKPETGKAIKSWLDNNTKMELFLELMYNKDLILVTTICETAGNKDDLLKSIVHLFEYHNQSLSLFDNLIEKEVSRTKTESTLFRSNSVASKMLSMYTKMLGNSFLVEVIKPSLQQVITNNLNLEIDPNKANSSINIENNLQIIQQISQELLNRIIQSIDLCPPQFQDVCATLFKTIQKKFPEDPYNGIRNFMFLRYICPAILNPPADFQFTDISENSRRTLVLISKILQNVINGAEFKEVYLKDLNNFVNQMQSSIRLCFQKLSEGSRGKVYTSVPKHFNVKESSRIVFNSLADIKDTLVDKLKQYDATTHQQLITFITSERLVSVCVEKFGVPSKNKNKKLPFNQEDSKTNELISLVSEELKLSLELVEIAYIEKDNKVIQSLVNVVTYSNNGNNIVILLKNILTKETQSLSFDQLLQDSITAKLLGYYSKLVLSDYVKELMSPSITELLETKDELKSASDKLLEFTQKLLALLLKSLTTNCPSSIWEIANCLYKEVSKEKKNHKYNAIEKVFIFLILSIFCPIVESPEQFNSTLSSDVSKKKVKKSLALCSELLKYIAYNSAEGSENKDPRITSFISKRREISLTLLEDWVNHPVISKEGSHPNIQWNLIEDDLRLLHSHLCDKLTLLSNRLGNSGITKRVNFRLSELIDSMITSSKESKDAVKSNVF